jgi:hypothetical protein
VTGLPNTMAPENSKMEARIIIWKTDSTFEPYVVPKELAKSLLPIPHASINEFNAPATKIQVYIILLCRYNFKY